MSDEKNTAEPTGASGGSIACARLVVRLSVLWESVPPDCSECVACGERCYLGQRELVAKTSGGKVACRSGYFKCVACSE